MLSMVYAVYIRLLGLYIKILSSRWKYIIRPQNPPDQVVCYRKPLYPLYLRGLERVFQGNGRYVPYIGYSIGYTFGISWYVDIWWIIPFFLVVPVYIMYCLCI